MCGKRHAETEENLRESSKKQAVIKELVIGLGRPFPKMGILIILSKFVRREKEMRVSRFSETADSMVKTAQADDREITLIADFDRAEINKAQSENGIAVKAFYSCASSEMGLDSVARRAGSTSDLAVTWPHMISQLEVNDIIKGTDHKRISHQINLKSVQGNDSGVESWGCVGINGNQAASDINAQDASPWILASVGEYSARRGTRPARPFALVRTTCFSTARAGTARETGGLGTHHGEIESRRDVAGTERACMQRRRGIMQDDHALRALGASALRSSRLGQHLIKRAKGGMVAHLVGVIDFCGLRTSRAHLSRANSCGGNRRRVPHRGGIESRAGVRVCGSRPSKWGLTGSGVGAVHQAALGWLSKDDDEAQGRRRTGLWARDAENAEGGRVSGRGLHLRRGTHSSSTHYSRTSSGSSCSGACSSTRASLAGVAGAEADFSSAAWACVVGKSDEMNEPIPDILDGGWVFFVRWCRDSDSGVATKLRQ
ncbi:hypothetical protein DFH09DRAFT_1088596 [Mycena vulgaris]|nr:hypothetical protein DFH09DRAFT_1088596 [Mycena vulgaris]